MEPALVVDDLSFEVLRSDRRKTMQITVDRGGELRVAAPVGCPTDTIAGFVREKRYWIYTKLAEKEALTRLAPTKEYKTGEGFLYLGRSHRLLLVGNKTQDVAVKLERGRFKMRREDAATGRDHMVRWYGDHAEPWLTRRVSLLAPRVGVEPSGVTVQSLGYRWGSCGKGGVLNFHWRTILLPPNVVEYVVVHELVHLLEAHHTPEFWRLVERAMPDFGSRRQWLAEHGAEVASV